MNEDCLMFLSMCLIDKSNKKNTKEKFVKCGNISRLRKIFFSMEKFLNHGIVSQACNFSNVEEFQRCRTIPQAWKSSLSMKIILDTGKKSNMYWIFLVTGCGSTLAVKLLFDLHIGFCWLFFVFSSSSTLLTSLIISSIDWINFSLFLRSVLFLSLFLFIISILNNNKNK